MRKLFLMALLAVGMSANAQFLEDNNNEFGNVGGVNLGDGVDENDCWTLHVNFGVNVPTSVPDDIEFAPFRSWEIGVTVLQYDYTPKNWKTTFSAGLGFDWRNYTLKGHDNAFEKFPADKIKKPNDCVYVVTPVDKCDARSSRIHTVSLSMPLLVKQSFSKNFAISVGAQLNWNFRAHIHNYYEEGDIEISEDTKKIGQRPFTVDILGIVHVHKFGVYCKYSPMSVLKTDRGPEFKSLAFGLYF